MLSGISIWQLLIILVIIMLLFGTKKLRGMGGDLGSAIKGFKDSMKDGEQNNEQQDADRRVIDNGEQPENDTSERHDKETDSSS